MDSSSDSHYDSDSTHVQSRPNRFHGYFSTWRTLTAEDRAINTSLVRQRNEDLSIHLYNAHALKKRVREAKDKSETHDDFVPPKIWTAWPLPPEIVPREDELVGEDDGLEECTLKREDRYRPSRVLEDVLTGTTLRIAKERLNDRAWASEDEENITAQDEDDQEAREGSNQDVEMADGGSVQAAAENGVLPTMKPVFSADDDRSKDLLRPTIRHNLSKLDDLLLALHHSRRSCVRATSVESDAQTDITNLDQNEIEASPSKRQKTSRKGAGRPRKYENATNYAEYESVIGTPSPAKKTNRGRPKKEYPRLPNESDYEFAVRIARLKKQPLPPPPKFLSPVPESVRSTPSPRKRRTLEAELKTEMRWKPRDWSEVLGAAAIIGFPEEVIARATQRCANLFGEGMVMRSLEYGGPSKGELVTYLPEIVPVAGDDDDRSYSENEDGNEDGDEIEPSRLLKKTGSGRRDSVVQPESESESELEHDTEIGGKRRRPPKASKETYWCPIPTCHRNKTGFGRGTHLRRHLITQHGYSKTSPELEKAVACGKNGGYVDGASTKAEEIRGGVHVDGFLGMVGRVRPGREGDAKKRKKKVGLGNRMKGSGRGKSGSKSESEEEDEEDDDDEDDEEGDDDDEEEDDDDDEEEKGAKRHTRRVTKSGNSQAQQRDHPDTNPASGHQMHYGPTKTSFIEEDSASGSDFEMDEDGTDDDV